MSQHSKLTVAIWVLLQIQTFPLFRVGLAPNLMPFPLSSWWLDLCHLLLRSPLPKGYPAVE